MYNGYVNYETWNVALWLSNDYGTYTMFYERAQELLDEYADEETEADRKHYATVDLAKEIHAFVEDGNPLASEASMYSDMLGRALGMVEWYDVAETFTEE